MKKKILCFMLAICMIVSCSFVMVGCRKKSTTHALNVKNAYAMSAVAGATYLSGQESGQALLTMSTAVNSVPEAVKNGLSDFNKYMQMFEGYLLTGKTNVSTTQASGEDLNKTYGTYTVTENSIKQVIAVPMLDGTNDSYTIYYTEQSGNTYVKADDDDKKEVHAQLSGVVVLANDTYYTLSGTRETETKKNEYECEIEFIIRKDETHFVKMEYSNELEHNETEDTFEISIYEGNNSVAVSTTEVSFEKENDEIKMELEFNDDVPSANHSEYTVKPQKENNKDVYIVDYNLAGSIGSFKVEYQDETHYNYVFADGTSKLFDR